MHVAKTDVHFQLFKAEHRSFYSPQGLAILDECRTVANVGWIRSRQAQARSRYHPYGFVSRRDLAEIDISNVFAGAFMRIKAVPIFNEFDLWQPYIHGEPIRGLGLYLVESSACSLF